MTPNKVCPVVVRERVRGVEILMFRHPRAGCQLVKGTIEAGEAPQAAALRELFEETGIAGARVVEDLGLWDAGTAQQVWSFQRCEPVQPPPDGWSHHCADGGGHAFELFWHPLSEEPADAHPVFVRALRSIRERLRMHAGVNTQLPDASCPPPSWELSANPEAFLAGAGEFLRSQPVQNTVLLTVASSERHRRAQGTLFGWLHGCGAFLVTPPRPAALSGMPPSAAIALAAKLASAGVELPGAAGPHEPVAAFASEWLRLRGGQAREHSRRRLYRLTELNPPERMPPGAARVALATDRALLLEWMAAFSRSVGDSNMQSEALVDERLALGSMWLWEDAGVPVSMATMSPPLAGMTRIQAVFTPERHRCRGYAAAVTAAVTRAAQQTGASDIVLYTDVENATSNALYQRLGYTPIEDRVTLDFTP